MANEANPCPCNIGDVMDYGGLGQEVQVEHLKVYVVKPSSASDKAIIVIHDVFGAVCPDFFVGKEPWSPSGDWSIFWEWVKDRKQTEMNKEVDAVLRFLKEQCGAKRIGVVGFCWGGIATHYISLQCPEIKAGVSNYGIISDREDKYALKSPTLFIFAGNDDFVPLNMVSNLEASLKQKCTVDYQVKIFPGQTHGFVHRKSEDINPDDKASIMEARADMLNWLKKYM